jgi:hypothetical protein
MRGATDGLHKKTNPCFGTPPCKLLNTNTVRTRTPHRPHTEFTNVIQSDMEVVKLSQSWAD